MIPKTTVLKTNWNYVADRLSSNLLFANVRCVLIAHYLDLKTKHTHTNTGRHRLTYTPLYTFITHYCNSFFNVALGY